jgi:hypothetical protein
MPSVICDNPSAHIVRELEPNAVPIRKDEQPTIRLAILYAGSSLEGVEI